MGVEVVVSGADEGELDAIRRLFEDWDRVFSRFLPDSELNRVNRDPSPLVVLSRPFAYALRTALAAAATTDGLVDPTLGSAIEAAGYDRDFRCSARTSGRPQRRLRAHGTSCGSQGGSCPVRPVRSST